MASKLLARALSKTHRHDKKVWTGYLTSTEILALVEDGAKDTSPNNTRTEWSKTDVATGKIKSYWFYFTLGRTSPYQYLKETQHHGKTKPEKTK